MMSRMIFPIFISLFILLAAGYLAGEKGGNSMVVTKLVNAANKEIPPIDKDVPATIKTATFAMG